MDATFRNFMRYTGSVLMRRENFLGFNNMNHSRNKTIVEQMKQSLRVGKLISGSSFSGQLGQSGHLRLDYSIARNLHQKYIQHCGIYLTINGQNICLNFIYT